MCCCILGSNSCKAGLEAEVARLKGENNRVTAECGRLKEDNVKLAHSQSQLQDHTNKMKEELKGKYSTSPFTFCCPPCHVVFSHLMSCTVFSFESQCQEAPRGRDQRARRLESTMPQGHRGAGHVEQAVPRNGNWHCARP